MEVQLHDIAGTAYTPSAPFFMGPAAGSVGVYPRASAHPTPGAVGNRSPKRRVARRRPRYSTATGMPANFPAQAAGPVSCTEVPSELTATVTGMSRTSNS